MLSYPAPLSTRSLNHLADLIRAHRHQRRSRWLRLDPGRQALPASRRCTDTASGSTDILTVPRGPGCCIASDTRKINGDHHSRPALLRRVDPYQGLTDADLSAVRHWLEQREQAD
jgi:hypothetical protein